jgi:hypothetical protein
MRLPFGGLPVQVGHDLVADWMVGREDHVVNRHPARHPHRDPRGHGIAKLLLKSPALQVDHFIAVVLSTDDVEVACQLDSPPVPRAVKCVHPCGERFAVRPRDSLHGAVLG